MRRLGIAALVAVVMLPGACGSSEPERAADVTNTLSPATEESTLAEHAVLVHITGLPEESGLDVIEDPLVAAIDRAGVGELDGNEIGPDEAVLYMYGPDGDALWAAVEPVLRAASLGQGSYAVIRYGEAGARERRVELG